MSRFTSFCDDPELACCRAERELAEYRSLGTSTDFRRAAEQISRIHKILDEADAGSRISPNLVTAVGIMGSALNDIALATGHEFSCAKGGDEYEDKNAYQTADEAVRASPL